MQSDSAPEIVGTQPQPTVEVDLQAQWTWSPCCVKFRKPVSRPSLSGGLPRCQKASQESCQAVKRSVRRAARLSRGLSGGLPGCQDACQETCQAVKRPLKRAGGLSGGSRGQSLETFGQFRGSSSPEPSGTQPRLTSRQRPELSSCQAMGLDLLYPSIHLFISPSIHPSIYVLTCCPSSY